MALNETVTLLVEQAFDEIGRTQVAFWIKFFAILGLFYVFSMVLKTGASLIDVIIYVVAFLKWLVYKIMGKDV